MLRSLSRKKEESINDLEELKRKVVLSFDEKIDLLYQKRDSIREVMANRKELRTLRLGVWTKLMRTRLLITLKYVFSMPFIYLMIVPGLLMHLCLEVYHQVCFRIYGIPLVKPRDHFIFDRHLLPQLNWLEKFNCFYCSYYNCLVSYLQEIVGRTERFWCPIKHARRMENPHRHYERFVDYADAEHLRKNWKDLRVFEELKNKK